MSKIILITGGSGDIGQAIAKAFDNEYESNYVITQYHNNYPKYIPKNGFAIKCNLTNEEEIGEMFTEIKSKIGMPDVLINNAGISEFAMMQDISLKQFNNMIATNLTSAFLCSRFVTASMVQKRSGSIVNISSIWGEIGASCEVHYSTAKGGLIAFTKALAKELAPSGILVNCVSPGLIESKMNSKLSAEDILAFEEEIPLGRSGKPEEVAELVRFLALKNTYITGQNISINGGINC